MDGLLDSEATNMVSCSESSHRGATLARGLETAQAPAFPPKRACSRLKPRKNDEKTSHPNGYPTRTSPLGLVGASESFGHDGFVALRRPRKRPRIEKARLGRGECGSIMRV